MPNEDKPLRSKALVEQTHQLGHLYDDLRRLQQELRKGLPVEITDPLHRANLALADAQRALTYELGLAVRVESWEGPRPLVVDEQAEPA